MKPGRILFGVIFVFAVALAPCQQAPAPARPSRLVTGKIMYVAPMPNQLDQWLIQDLRAWGNYQISGNSEGVDLVMSARTPPKHIQYNPSNRVPLRRPAAKPPVLSINVVNWVTGQRVWQCKLSDHKPKKNATASAGPDAILDAHGMKPEEIAERCVRLLGQYVAQLQRGHP